MIGSSFFFLSMWPFLHPFSIFPLASISCGPNLEERRLLCIDIVPHHLPCALTRPLRTPFHRFARGSSFDNDTDSDEPGVAPRQDLVSSRGNKRKKDADRSKEAERVAAGTGPYTLHILLPLTGTRTRSGQTHGASACARSDADPRECQSRNWAWKENHRGKR